MRTRTKVILGCVAGFFVVGFVGNLVAPAEPDVPVKTRAVSPATSTTSAPSPTRTATASAPVDGVALAAAAFDRCADQAKDQGSDGPWMEKDVFLDATGGGLDPQWAGYQVRVAFTSDEPMSLADMAGQAGNRWRFTDCLLEDLGGLEMWTAAVTGKPGRFGDWVLEVEPLAGGGPGHYALVRHV